MASIPNNEEWRDFFQCLKDLPELWQVKSDVYKDRNRKRAAWGTLLQCYRKVEKEATVESLKKRLGNIRSCFRRELKKTEQSHRCGAGEEDCYLPSLWYFDLLEFMRDQETQIQGISTLDDDDEVLELPLESSSGTQMKRKKSISQHMEERNDLLKNALGQLSQSREAKDDTSVYAEAWAASYRKLSGIQRIYAKKAIEDILVLGQLELLHLNSVPTNIHPVPPRSHYSSASSSASSTSSVPIIIPSHSLSPSQQSPIIFGRSYENVHQLLQDNDFL